MSLRAKTDKAGIAQSALKSKVKASLHPCSRVKTLGKPSSVTKPTVSSANKRSTTQTKKAGVVSKPAFSKPGYSLYDSTASESSEPCTKEAADIIKGVENATDIVRQMVNCRKGRLVKQKVKSKRAKSSISKTKRDQEQLTNGIGARESSDGSPKQTNRPPLIIPTAEKDGSSPVSVKSAVPAFNRRLHSSTPDPEKLYEEQQAESTQQRTEAVQTSSSLFANADTNLKNNPNYHHRNFTNRASSPREITLPAPVPIGQHPTAAAYIPMQTNNSVYPQSLPNYPNPNLCANLYPTSVSNNPSQFGNPVSHGLQPARNGLLYIPVVPDSARIQVPSNSPRAQNTPPITVETNTYTVSNPSSVPSSPNSRNFVVNTNEIPPGLTQQDINIANIRLTCDGKGTRSVSLNETDHVPLLSHVVPGQSDISTDYVSLPSPTQIFGLVPQVPTHGAVTFSPRSGESLGFTPRPSGSEGFVPDLGNAGQSARSASSFTNVVGPYSQASANQITRNLTPQFSANQIPLSVDLGQNAQGQVNQLLMNNTEYVNAMVNNMSTEPQRVTASDGIRRSPILNTIPNQPAIGHIHNTPQVIPAFNTAGFNHVMPANVNNIPFGATQHHPQMPTQYYGSPYATNLHTTPVSNVPVMPGSGVSGQYYAGQQHNWTSTVNSPQVLVQEPVLPASRKEIEVKIKTLKLLIRELKAKWAVSEVDTSDMRQLTDDLEKTVNDIPLDSSEYGLDAQITKAIRPLKDENDMLKRELQLALASKFNTIGSQHGATNDIEVLTLQISKTSLERQLHEEKERNDGLNDRVNDMQIQLDNMKAERHKMMLNMTEKDPERLKPKFESQQAVARLRTEVNLAHKQMEGLKLKVNAAEKENHILAITLGQRDTEIDRLQELVQTMKSSISTMLQGHLQGNTDEAPTRNQGWMGAGMNLQKLDKLLREEKNMGPMPRSPAKSVHSDPGHETNNPGSPSSTLYPSTRNQLSSRDVFRLTRDNLAKHDHGMVSQQGYSPSKSVAKHPPGILKTANHEHSNVRDRELYTEKGMSGFASSSPIKTIMNGIAGKETLDDIVEELSDVTMTETMLPKQGEAISAKMIPGFSPYKDNKTGLNSIRDIRSDSVTDARADNVTDVTSVSRYSVTDYFKKYSEAEQNTDFRDVRNVKCDTEAVDISIIQPQTSVQDNRTNQPLFRKTAEGLEMDRKFGAQRTESELKPVKSRSDPQIQPLLTNSRPPLPGNHDDNVSIVSAMTMNSVSTAMTVDENVFRDGLASLDANIARIQENLLQTRDVYGVP